MINSLKLIPQTACEIAGEIYDLAANLTLDDCLQTLKETIKTVAMAVFATSFYSSLTPICPYLLAISFTSGLAFSDFFMDKTSHVFAAIFQTKELPPSQSTKKIAQIAHFVLNKLNRIKPVVVTGFIGFFGLPVVSVQIISVLAGLRLGSYFGKMADTAKFQFQAFYIA